MRRCARFAVLSFARCLAPINGIRPSARANKANDTSQYTRVPATIECHAAVDSTVYRAPPWAGDIARLSGYLESR